MATVVTPELAVPREPRQAEEWTESQLKARFQSLGYNMLDCDMAARTALANPSKTYTALKQRAHAALATGRDNMLAGNNSQANSNFAFAYQMRCCCDWIWVNLMGQTGNMGHAAYLQVSRKFSRCANGRLTAEDKETISRMIKKIRG